MAYRAVALLASLMLVSCTDEKVSPTASTPLTVEPPCAAENLVGGTCAGVPAKPICDGDVCTLGVSCGTVIAVAGSADLAGAVGRAGPGTCLALARGDYDEVALPGGVSLLGRGAADVRVAKVSIAAG